MDATLSFMEARCAEDKTDLQVPVPLCKGDLDPGLPGHSLILPWPRLIGSSPLYELRLPDFPRKTNRDGSLIRDRRGVSSWPWNGGIPLKFSLPLLLPDRGPHNLFIHLDKVLAGTRLHAPVDLKWRRAQRLGLEDQDFRFLG